MLHIKVVNFSVRSCLFNRKQSTFDWIAEDTSDLPCVTRGIHRQTASTCTPTRLS